MSEKYNRLKELLLNLFQLDQPELDFGLYRIMHAKSDEITSFLECDLLPQVKDALSRYESSSRRELEQELDEAISQAEQLGADPDSLPKVKELRKRLEKEAVDLGAIESDVYDHLYRFFRRYYHEGDFISKRVYKEGVYAIPYEGEEVKLYWANYDQYYIKTDEYLRDYTFKLHPDSAADPMRTHFKLADAIEGEHGNVRESNKRIFVLKGDDCLKEEDGELTIFFEYRPATTEDWGKDEREGKTKPPDQKKLLDYAEKRILTSLSNGFQRWLSILNANYVKSNGERADYTRLRAHLNRYTARNTFDYFIHKDLGGFLRRELDFYIKNEIMHLDDIENEEAPRVEQILSKIKVIRKIAGKIIDFLAQLEDFQKRLWLKKKFVVETNYCITLDRVPEELYPEIAGNDSQREEWVELFAIDEIGNDGDGSGARQSELFDGEPPDYSEPLTVEFLKSNPYLVLDTKHFSEEFKERLLDSIDDLDENLDGLLIHSENFQALNLLQERYREQVKCIHIDPPYNTSTSGFLYKNEYKHSSWLSLMENRVLLSMKLLNVNAFYLCHIDENEYEKLFMIFHCTGLNDAGTIIWDKRNPMNAGQGVAIQHEYIVFRSTNRAPIYLPNDKIRAMLAKAKELMDRYGVVNESMRNEFSLWINSNERLTGGEKAYRYIDKEGRIYQSVSLRAPERREDPKFHRPLIHPVTGKPCAIPPNGFSRTPETLRKMIKAGHILFGPDERTQPRQKVFLSANRYRQISSVIHDAMKGKAYLDALGLSFPYCHPVSLYSILIGCVTKEENTAILDYFAGSGTTAHAVINLNREDGGERKYILVEMGDYFDTVLVPRIKKVVYAKEWKDGKPKERDTGISHAFKYIRLESYEDTLNNLDVKKTKAQEELLFSKEAKGEDGLAEEYILKYMLDVETRGSNSLLNIGAFADPLNYKLKVKIPGSEESRIRRVDLIETFNYLIGLKVEHIGAPHRVTASFKRDDDPDLPESALRRLVLDGKLKGDKEGRWWFRPVEGRKLDGTKVLVIWRNRPGCEEAEGIEEDNLVLNEWFKKQNYSSKDAEFDLIYVNGDNNIENLKLPDDTWKVRLIEEEFFRLMFAEEAA